MLSFEQPDFSQFKEDLLYYFLASLVVLFPLPFFFLAPQLFKNWKKCRNYHYTSNNMQSILHKAVQIIVYMCQMLDRFLGTVTAWEIMAGYFKIFHSLDSLGSIFYVNWLYGVILLSI